MLTATLLLATAVAAAFAVLLPTFRGRLSFLECAFMAPGLGLSASAWITFLTKSVAWEVFGVRGIPWLSLAAAIAVQAGVAWRWWPACARALDRKQVAAEVREHYAALLMLAALSVWLTWMSYIHYLLPRGSDYLCGGSVYADLPFHLNLATSFLDGCNDGASVLRHLVSPFYAGATLAYPFLPDWYIAVLRAGGFSLRVGLVATGAVLLSALFAQVYSLNYAITGSSRAAAISVWVTLLSGGIGGFLYAAETPGWWTPAALTSSAFIHGPDHVLYWVRGLTTFWFALPAHILFPQRTTQHAYPLALAALLLAWHGLRETERHAEQMPPAGAAGGTGGDGGAAVAGCFGVDVGSGDHRHGGSGRRGDGDRRKAAASAASASTLASAPEDASAKGKALLASPAELRALFVGAGAATALLPLMQPHAFTSVGIVLLVAAALQAANAAARWRWAHLRAVVLHWSLYGAAALGGGLPQFLYHYAHRVSFGVGGGARGSSAFVRWVPAWVEMHTGDGPVSLWWRTLGGIIPLWLVAAAAWAAAPAAWRGPGPVSRAHAYVYVGFAVLFVACNLIMFQPWHMDNTKLLVVWMFGASGGVGALLDRAFALAARLPGGPAPRWAAGALTGALLGCLLFSGALAAWREMLNYAKTYDDADLDYADWLVRTTPRDSVFLHDVTEGNHIRVESSLAGRQVAFGYVGWLSSHGLNYGARYAQIGGVLSGANPVAAVRALAEIGVTHITVDAPRAKHFNADFLDAVADHTATNGKYALWRVVDEVRSGAFKPGALCAGAPAAGSAADCLRAGCWWAAGGGGERCTARPRSRRVEDCKQQSEEGCREEGCVWVAGFPGPWCQKPRWMTGQAPRPATMPQLAPGVPGSDCGWASMRPADCVKRGCDWRPAADPYAPWCVFKEALTSDPAVEVNRNRIASA